MQVIQTHRTDPPQRADVDVLPGMTLLEFGTSWCGYCQNAQPILAQALEGLPPLRHLKIEDGKGQALGRSFAVKLWPTLILLRDGHEMARVIRPNNADAMAKLLAQLSHPLHGSTSASASTTATATPQRNL